MSIPEPAPVVVLVATESALKIQAIRQAFKASTDVLMPIHGHTHGKHIFYHTDFFSVNAPSNINEQPIGWEETTKGARNRAENAVKLARLSLAPTFVIAIENGIVTVPEVGDDYFMDLAWVHFHAVGAGKTYHASSTSVSFHSDIVYEAKAKGLDKTTVGDVLHEKYPDVYTKDPHSSLLCGLLTRVDLMQQAVTSCIGQYLFDCQNKK